MYKQKGSEFVFPPCLMHMFNRDLHQSGSSRVELHRAVNVHRSRMCGVVVAAEHLEHCVDLLFRTAQGDVEPVGKQRPGAPVVNLVLEHVVRAGVPGRKHGVAGPLLGPVLVELMRRHRHVPRINTVAQRRSVQACGRVGPGPQEPAQIGDKRFADRTECTTFVLVYMYPSSHVDVG